MSRGHTNIGDDMMWEKFVSGDASCFETLFKKYYRNLYGYGLKLCNNPELVEDSIQELFEKIWQNRKELTHIRSPNVYLTVSLRRKLLKKLQRDKEKEKRLERETKSRIAITFGIEELIIRDESKKQQKEALLKALNQLSPRQKEVIYLRFYNGMSNSEIEQVLSINRQSVRNHTYRAMETLRTLLDDEVKKIIIFLVTGFLFLLG